MISNDYDTQPAGPGPDSDSAELTRRVGPARERRRLRLRAESGSDAPPAESQVERRDKNESPAPHLLHSTNAAARRCHAGAGPAVASYGISPQHTHSFLISSDIPDLMHILSKYAQL
jgi:hypothetical protein